MQAHADDTVTPMRIMHEIFFFQVIRFKSTALFLIHIVSHMV